MSGFGEGNSGGYAENVVSVVGNYALITNQLI